MGSSPSTPRPNKDAFPSKEMPSFKVVLIGEPNTGKTSVFLRYVKNQYNYLYKPTKKAVPGNVVKKINVPDHTIASLTIWDLPGLEDMDLRDSYYRNADAAIVVVDMTDDASIELASAWKQEFQNHVSKVQLTSGKSSSGATIPVYQQLPVDPKKIPVLLLGNKYDLVEEKLQAEQMDNALNVPIEEEIARTEDIKDTTLAVPDVTGLALSEMSSNIEDEESTEYEDEDLLQPQRGPTDDNKPECVKLLEKVEKEHGFAGSVMVSCKDNDDSVYGAIQSLVRYLVWKKLPNRPKKKKKEKKKKKVSLSLQRHFRETGVDKVNACLNRCHSIVIRIEKYIAYHDSALTRFKQQCEDAGFISNAKCSLEDAVISFRDTLQARELELKMEKQEVFLHLTIEKSDRRIKIDKEIKTALEIFNEEYVAVCCAVLRDNASICNFLIKMDAKIEIESDSLLSNAKSRDKETEKTLDIIDNNRAKILFFKSQIEDLAFQVENAENKVKAALIW